MIIVILPLWAITHLMSSKKENIISAALTLFAERGYFATSTNSIAAAAGVSEGLIFRHFGNKEGLLKAVLHLGEEKLKMLYADIVLQTNPENVISSTISLPFDVPVADYPFWHLQYKLKWELAEESNKLEPLEMALKNAFEKLKNPNPAMAAKEIILMIDAIGAALLKNELENAELLKTYLLEKYTLKSKWILNIYDKHFKESSPGNRCICRNG